MLAESVPISEKWLVRSAVELERSAQVLAVLRDFPRRKNFPLTKNRVGVDKFGSEVKICSEKTGQNLKETIVTCC
jgi:hypothetical protein